TTLASVEGMVATTDLEPGEQLLASRFSAPDALGGAVEVPEGLLLMSIELEPRRVIGGDLQPGDLVAIFVSEGEETSPDVTNLLQRDVLVVAVTGGVSVETDEQTGTETEQPASTSVVVTVAVSPTASQQLVYSIEYERIYLSLESETAPKEDVPLLTDVLGL
ncbi:RcpC/CpaB family pilus assembly protein, partial [Burkholderia cenocepacia]|uniref:RcpC/CpaB family pilus assembly protein n=1 Tax=Burkholderia cenocepacia TaxID=95486 RepID=UPI0038CBF4C9